MSLSYYSTSFDLNICWWLNYSCCCASQAVSSHVEQGRLWKESAVNIDSINTQVHFRSIKGPTLMTFLKSVFLLDPSSRCLIPLILDTVSDTFPVLYTLQRVRWRLRLTWTTWWRWSRFWRTEELIWTSRPKMAWPVSTKLLAPRTRSSCW